jgi:hypothetical protein
MEAWVTEIPGDATGDCQDGSLYTEPAAGFWIVNPSITLTDNSIGGCQGVGVGYWYVTSPDAAVQTLRLGTFLNNRAHGCFDGLYGENQFTVHSAQNLNPHVGRLPGGQPVIAKFDGLTATRNRDRGVWVRPFWNVVTNSAFATNRDSVTLLTAGGVDGTAPGGWDLLENSVVVGISANNVDRWGPRGARPASQGLSDSDLQPGGVHDLRQAGPHLQRSFRQLQGRSYAAARRDRRVMAESIQLEKQVRREQGFYIRRCLLSESRTSG